MQFSFPKGEPLRLKNAKHADANEIGAALSEIATKNGGSLQPKNVVDAARSPSNVLHKFFEWNDQIAAEAFRLDQARGLIRIVRVDVDEEPTRAFFSIKDDAGQCYRPVAAVLNSASLQLALLKAAERDLKAFYERYKVLRELFKPIAEAMRIIKRRIDETEHRPEV